MTRGLLWASSVTKLFLGLCVSQLPCGGDPHYRWGNRLWDDLPRAPARQEGTQSSTAWLATIPFFPPNHVLQPTSMQGDFGSVVLTPGRNMDLVKPKVIGGFTPRASSSLGLESDLRIYISNKFLGSADPENQPLREPLLVIKTSDHVQPDSLWLMVLLL